MLYEWLSYDLLSVIKMINLLHSYKEETMAQDAIKMSDNVSEKISDLSREDIAPGDWAPGKELLACIRSYQRLVVSKNPIVRALRKIFVLKHRFWSAVSGADIPLNSNIELGLLLPHPNGIVIHPSARIGPNCLIFQQVTIGLASPLDQRPPFIGGHVDIGAGAKILGPITIGDHSVIAAGAVVITNVPERSLAIGVPAVIRPLRMPDRLDRGEKAP